MAATRSRKVNRSRGKQQRSSGWMWLLTGILIGLGLAYYLWSKGLIPQPNQGQPQTDSTSSQQTSEKPLADGLGGQTEKPEKPRYDFFTVLPEMEVVVHEQELRESTKPSTTETTQPAGDENYLLQVGSFKQPNDAEQMKARLALLGMTANVQTVNVDGTTWHRVRIGPVNGARAADDFRQRLSNNGIESLVMKSP